MTDEEFDKIVGQFKHTLNTKIMTPLRQYGQGAYVDTALEEITSLAIQLHQKLSGIDEPYHVNHEKLHW